MSKRATATIRMNFPTEKQLTTLLAALSPEAKSPATQRATVQLKKDGSDLTLTVDAKDTVALRATLNAYLRWINSTLCVIDAVDNA